MADAVKRVFYGCNQCGKEFAVESEAEIPLGHLCSKKCRDAFVASENARDEATASGSDD
jgi:endogenous inhibitor of DNA gyrase (YacG/DUF329 family)